MDKFFRGYVECALWSSTDDDCEPLDNRFDVDDIAPATLARMRADCAAFEGQAGDDLFCDGAPDLDYAGHDFWLTRNGHGAGFWDGDWPEPEGSRLTALSKSFGEFYLYVGDDGLIHGE